MASILNTDIGDLYNQWGERVAFNEGYQAQKINEAKQAGRESFHLGLDSSQGKDIYFEKKDQRFAEAKEFLSGESVAQNNESDFIEGESEIIETDFVGDVTDGEETLGMESVVANETEDLSDHGITDEALQMNLNYDLNGFETYEKWELARGEFN